MIVPIFVLTQQYNEFVNKNGRNITVDGLNGHTKSPKTVLQRSGDRINQHLTKSALSDISRKNKTSRDSVTARRPKELRRWNSSHPFVFLHIGKNGGTSFDSAIGPIIRKLGGRYIGHSHFDWSHVETLKNPDVAVLLRDPVARSVSHFHFAKKLQYYKINVSLSEYIRNPQHMLEARDIWQDGQAAAMWLTGTHVANWVRIKPFQIPERESAFLDHETICLKAVSRLKDTLWFGFLDDQERSFDMLQWQLGYDKKIQLRTANKTPHPEVTAKDKAILESLMPIDLWIYDYAKSLFEARWKQYKTGVYKDPVIPSFPEMNCKSTRYILACNNKSPLGPLYHVWNATEEVEKHLKLLPKGEWITT